MILRQSSSTNITTTNKHGSQSKNINIIKKSEPMIVNKNSSMTNWWSMAYIQPSIALLLLVVLFSSLSQPPHKQVIVLVEGQLAPDASSPITDSPVGINNTLIDNVTITTTTNTTSAPSSSEGISDTSGPTMEVNSGESLSGVPTTVEAMGGPNNEVKFDANGRSIPNKLPKVNFTLVEEIFESVISDEEVKNRWKNLDLQLQNGIRSILKMIFPHIVSVSQDAKVSGDCSGGILRWILSLRNLRSWAVKMLDAVGKPSAGIFEGALTMFGNYRQCLSIRAADDDDIETADQFEEYFRGQYCIIHLKPWLPARKPFYSFNSSVEQLVRKDYPIYEKTLYDELAEIAVAFNFLDIRFDLCVPSTCTQEDIQRVTEYLTKKVELRAKVLRCDTEPREQSPPIYDRSHLIWAGVSLSVLAATIASTIFTILYNRYTIRSHRQSMRNDELNQNPTVTTSNTISNCSSAATNISIGGGPFRGSKRKSILSSMSITRSLKHYTHIERDNIQEHKPVALYGLRTLFVYWFMLVQMTVNINYQFLRESMTLRWLAIQYWPMQILVNSTMMYDSLILITAFTFAYCQFDSSIRDHLKYAVDKYVRLLPSILFVVALTILIPLLGLETPVWKDFTDKQSQVCKSNGFINIFFLQNFISHPKICLPQSWLICVELQLVIIMIPLVLLLKKNFYENEDKLLISNETKRATQAATFGIHPSTITTTLRSSAGLISLILIGMGWLVNFLSVYLNEFPPAWFYTFPDAQQRSYYFSNYLYRTWTHLSTFIIGILAGHLCKSASQLRQVLLVKLTQTPTDSTASLSSPVTCRASNYSIKLVTPSIWLAVATCMMAIIFSTYTWSTQTLPNPLIAGFYDATSRCLWSIALIVIMINISLPNPYDNQYSLLARILGHKMLVVLGRLSFLAYMVYPFVQSFILSVQEQALYPSLILIFHVFVGNLVITYFIAFLISILIEQPIRRLITKCFLGNRHCNQKINISTQLTGLTTTKASANGNGHNNNHQLNDTRQQSKHHTTAVTTDRIATSDGL